MSCGRIFWLISRTFFKPKFLAVLLLKQSATYLVCHVCVCRMAYVESTTPQPPEMAFLLGNLLISSMASEAAKKFGLKWNGSVKHVKNIRKLKKKTFTFLEKKAAQTIWMQDSVSWPLTHKKKEVGHCCLSTIQCFEAFLVEINIVSNIPGRFVKKY